MFRCTVADLQGGRGALAPLLPGTPWSPPGAPQEFFAPSMEEGGAQDFRSSRKKKLQPPYTLFLDPPLAVAEVMAAAVIGLAAASAATSGIAATFVAAATTMVRVDFTTGAATMAGAAHDRPSSPSPATMESLIHYHG